MSDEQHSAGSGGCSPQDLISFLRRLRTIRQFRPDPVPEAALDDILEVARWSGSASNQQPWDFVVVRDAATRQALAKAGRSVGHLAQAPVGILVVLAGQSAQTETFDEGRLTERVMLAAAAHGLAAGIGWFRDDERATVRQILGIPDDRLVRTEISIGYPTEEAQRYRKAPGEARKSRAELVHEDRY